VETGVDSDIVSGERAMPILIRDSTHGAALTTRVMLLVSLYNQGARPFQRSSHGAALSWFLKGKLDHLDTISVVLCRHRRKYHSVSRACKKSH